MRLVTGVWTAAGLASAVAFGVAGCAQLAADYTPDGGASGSDAAVPACDMAFSVTPPAPVAPIALVATAETIHLGGLAGIETFEWDVSRGATSIEPTPRDPDGKQVEIDADVSGTYRVVLRGFVGGTECTDEVQQINVAEPGAKLRAYRLRISPAAGQPAPVQDKVFSIPGGADYALGAIGLDTGLQVAGSLLDQGSAPLAGYVRATAVGSASLPEPEAFASVAGEYQLRLLPGSYDLLAVPEGNSVAPILFTGLAISELSTAHVVPPGQSWTGRVLGPTGSVVAGAIISMRIEGVPTTIATTDAAGGFSVAGRGAGDVRITVTPPTATGLPRLELADTVTLAIASGDVLTLRYAAAAAYRDLDVPVYLADTSTLAPTARVIFIARPISDSGTVTVTGQSAVAMVGQVRKAAVADAAGRVVVRLPEAIYDVVVEPPTGAAAVDGTRLLEVNVSAGNASPASLALGGTATLTGRVVDTGDVPLAGARVAALPRGLIAGVPGAASVATTDVAGNYALPLIGGGNYELVVDALAGRRARGRTSVVAPAPGASAAAADVRLDKAIRITGTVSIVGVAGGARGVHISVQCFGCVGISAPLAEAVTDDTGAFALLVPDPGTGQ